MPPPSLPSASHPTWECQITTTPQNPAGFTVGDVYELVCKGTPLPLTPPFRAVMPKKFDNALVILKTKHFADGEARFDATSYRVGEIKFPPLEILDQNGNGFLTSPLAVKVRSVIEKKDQKQEMYGPVMAIPMETPMWVFVTPAIVFFAIIGWILIFLRRRLQRKLLEKNIKKFQSPMGSYHQFSKDLRQLKSGVVFSEHTEWNPSQVRDYLLRLNEGFRLFLLREFIVPATSWSSRNTVKHIQRKDRRGYEKYRSVLQKALKELDRALGSPDGFKSKDCEQLTQICWQAVDLIWKTKRDQGPEKGRSA